jgi:signal transduction histidine kinase/CheY-like chemotaxis protein
MREFLFNRPGNQSARSNEEYRAEILDLRADILTGLLMPLFVLGWVGMAYALALSPVRPEWAVALTFAVVLIFAVVCAWLNWSGRRGVAVRVFPFGLWGLAAGYWLISQDALSLIWIAITCVLITLLIGTGAGATSVILTAACAVWAASNAHQSATAFNLIPIVVPLSLLVLVTHTLARALFHTLRWMSDGYSLAHQQADQLRDQSAELAGALKSLSQTSFALARANEQMEIMVKYAEDARRSKQEFAANISHELRTPLNLIIGFSDVILHAPSSYNVRRLPPGLLADIHVIYHNAQHLLKLVNDILDLSQVDVNYMTIAREPMNVAEFIHSALEDFGRLVEERGLYLVIDVQPDLPDIYADRTRVRQVLLNLINNALRFTDTGGITIRAALQTTPAPKVGSNGGHATNMPEGAAVNPPCVVISVSDTGVGIAPADLQRIFEPFTQLDSSIRRKHGGSGLGLTISKRFVELHGGRMWVESTPDVGSTFSFSLPVQPALLETSIVGTLRQVHRREVGSLAVVDRSPLLARLLERYIEGISVVRVRSLQELQDQAISPEVVLINEPPGSDAAPAMGTGALVGVPTLRCFIPSVLAHGSAHGAGWPVDAQPDERSLAAYYLVKPIVREQLYEALAGMLSVKRTATAAAGADVPTPDVVVKRNARILVVEDDEESLALLGRMLRTAPPEVKQGYSAIASVEARSGEQALELLASAEGADFDGILLDMKLGAVSGLDVLAELEKSERLRHIPICIVSGQEIWGEALISQYVSVSRQGGLPARQLMQVVAALLPLMLPGFDVSMR